MTESSEKSKQSFKKLNYLNSNKKIKVFQFKSEVGCVRESMRAAGTRNRV